jgi:putative peptidoglycan lipid II flippase
MASEPEGTHRASRLLKSTSVVSSMTLLSRVSGLARDITFSHWFGAGIVMDAFIVAFKIPNLLRRFFAEGAFSQAFVPVIAEYRATRSWADVRELIDRVSGALGLVLFAITAIGVIAAPLLIIAFAPGWVDDGGGYELATDMLRFTFPYLFFISLTGLAGGILNTYGRFAVPAFTPVLLNLSLIVFAAWVSPQLERPGLALAYGVFAAGLVQLVFQVPFLMRAGLLPRPKWGAAHEGVRRILKLMVPVIFGSSVAQINIMLDTLIASFLVTGSISWLYYSDRLVEFPLGVFGIALATVILPSLSEHHARASKESFSATLDWALRCVLLVSLPAAVGLVVLAKPTLITIFYGGVFTEADVDMAATSLRAFAPGLVGFILVKVLSPGYFARQDTRTPVRIGIRALVLAMVFNVIFVVTLVYTRWAPAHAGLAAATTLSALLNSTWLLRGLVHAGVYRASGGWKPLFARVVGACVAMALFAYWLLGQLGDWYAMSTAAQIAALSLAVASSGTVYLAACYVLGLRISHFRHRAPV